MLSQAKTASYMGQITQLPKGAPKTEPGTSDETGDNRGAGGGGRSGASAGEEGGRSSISVSPLPPRFPGQQKLSGLAVPVTERCGEAGDDFQKEDEETEGNERQKGRVRETGGKQRREEGGKKKEEAEEEKQGEQRLCSSWWHNKKEPPGSRACRRWRGSEAVVSFLGPSRCWSGCRSFRNHDLEVEKREGYVRHTLQRKQPHSRNRAFEEREPKKEELQPSFHPPHSWPRCAGWMAREGDEGWASPCTPANCQPRLPPPLGGERLVRRRRKRQEDCRCSFSRLLNIYPRAKKKRKKKKKKKTIYRLKMEGKKAEALPTNGKEDREEEKETFHQSRNGKMMEGQKKRLQENARPILTNRQGPKSIPLPFH